MEKGKRKGNRGGGKGKRRGKGKGKDNTYYSVSIFLAFHPE